VRRKWIFVTTVLILGSAATFSAYRVRGAIWTSAQSGSGTAGVDENVHYGPGPLRLDVYKPADAEEPSCDCADFTAVAGRAWTKAR